jgi:hypothetical protein
MVWFTQEAVERWRAETRTTPGAQRTYSTNCGRVTRL